MLKVFIPCCLILIFCSACDSDNIKLYKEYVESVNDRDDNNLYYLLEREFNYKFTKDRCNTKPSYCESRLGQYLKWKVRNMDYEEKIELLQLEEIDKRIIAIVKFKNLDDVYLDLDVPVYRQKVYFSEGHIKKIVEETVPDSFYVEGGNKIKEDEFARWLLKKHPQSVNSMDLHERCKILQEYYQEVHGNGSLPDEAELFELGKF